MMTVTPRNRTRNRAHHVAARPAWVVHNGVTVHVSVFAGIPRRKRPVLHCPECGGEAVPKLGPIKAHHFAHAAKDRPCAITQPETALHFNAKFHVAAQLEEAARTGANVVLRSPCIAGVRPGRQHTARPDAIPWYEWEIDRCPATDDRPWDVMWDEVKVEQRLATPESRRVPDILLLRQGKAVAAVEIYATHLVDDEKATVLANVGLPWIEVVASDVLPLPPAPNDSASRATQDVAVMRSPWLVSHPLPLFRESARDAWRCPHHQERYERWLEDQERERRAAERRAAEEAEAARHTARVTAVRIVDVMYPSGRHYRNIYRVEERSTDAQPHTIALMLNERTLSAIRLGSTPKATLWARLKRECERQIGYVQARASIIDSPMSPGAEWITGAVAARAWKHASTAFRWPFKYPLADHYPLRYRKNRTTGAWFMPHDLRAVRWDRQADDPFHPHPASHQSTPRPSAPPAPDAGRWTRHAPPGTGEVVRLGGRLAAADLGVPVLEIIDKTIFRVFAVQPLSAPDGPPLAVTIPCGKADVPSVRKWDRRLRDEGATRLWVSPPGDWTRELAGVPWCPVSRDATGGLGVPERTGFATLIALLDALGNGTITPDDVVAWGESSRLSY